MLSNNTLHTIFSIGGLFHLVSNFTELHAFTPATCFYGLLTGEEGSGEEGSGEEGSGGEGSGRRGLGGKGLVRRGLGRGGLVRVGGGRVW